MLGLLTLGDVPRHTPHAPILAVGAEQWNPIDLGDDQSAISVPNGLLQRRKRFAGRETGRHSLADLLDHVLRKKVERGLPEEFRGRITRHIQELGTEVGVATLGIDLPNTVAAGLDQRTEFFLADSELLFHPLAFGDVLDNGEIARGPFGFDLELRYGQVNPDHRSVRAEVTLGRSEIRNLPGVKLHHVVEVFAKVVRVGYAHPVERRQLLGCAAENLGVSRVGLDDPTAVRVDQGDAKRCLLEDKPETGFGRLPGSQGGQLPAPEQIARGIQHQQDQTHDQRDGPGRGTDTGIGLAFVDLGDHRPGRSGDGGGVGQHRNAAIVPSAGEDAPLA